MSEAPSIPDPDDVSMIILAGYQGYWQTFPSEMIPGTTAIRANCGHLSLISPTGQFHLDRFPQTYTCCEPCYQKSVQPADNTRVVVPGGVEEVLASLPPGSEAILQKYLDRNDIGTSDGQ